MSTQQILSRAADIVEQGWTQGVYAVDSEGSRAFVGDPIACKFCTVGAIRKAAAEKGASCYPADALHHFANHEGITNIAAWNDDPSRTQGQVVAALRNAAK